MFAWLFEIQLGWGKAWPHQWRYHKKLFGTLGRSWWSPGTSWIVPFAIWESALVVWLWYGCVWAAVLDGICSLWGPERVHMGRQGDAIRVRRLVFATPGVPDTFMLNITEPTRAKCTPCTAYARRQKRNTSLGAPGCRIFDLA